MLVILKFKTAKPSPFFNQLIHYYTLRCRNIFFRNFPEQILERPGPISSVTHFEPKKRESTKIEKKFRDETYQFKLVGKSRLCNSLNVVNFELVICSPFTYGECCLKT